MLGALAGFGGTLPTQLMEDILSNAYIRVEEVPPSLNVAATHPFKRNLDQQTLFEDASKVMSSPTYWSVRLVDAYDPEVSRDNDPGMPGYDEPTSRNERAAMGQTFGLIPRGQTQASRDLDQPICEVFRETIRDASEKKGWVGNPVPVIESVTAHEVICHALHIGHIADTLCHPLHLEGGGWCCLSERTCRGVARAGEAAALRLTAV